MTAHTLKSEKLYWLFGETQSLSESEVIEAILAGRLTADHRASEKKPGWMGADFPFLSAYPVFAEVLAKTKASEELRSELANPGREANLSVRDLDKDLGEYTALQIRHLFSTGKITARSVFKNGGRGDWTPCVRLVGNTEPDSSSLLLAQLKAVTEQCEKTKWAVRGVLILMLTLFASVVLFGIK